MHKLQLIDRKYLSHLTRNRLTYVIAGSIVVLGLLILSEPMRTSSLSTSNYKETNPNTSNFETDQNSDSPFTSVLNDDRNNSDRDSDVTGSESNDTNTTRTNRPSQGSTAPNSSGDTTNGSTSNDSPQIVPQTPRPVVPKPVETIQPALPLETVEEIPAANDPVVPAPKPITPPVDVPDVEPTQSVSPQRTVENTVPKVSSLLPL